MSILRHDYGNGPCNVAGADRQICEELDTVMDEAAVPPNVTAAPEAKFAPLIVTVVPPEIGPEEGEIPLTTGAEAPAMLMLKFAVPVVFEESVASTVKENVPDWEGVPEIEPPG